MLVRSWVRPPPTPQQCRYDVGLGLLAAVGCVISVEVWRSAFGAPLGAYDVEAYVLFGVAGAALAGRRRLPLTTLLVESALFIVIGERLETLGGTFTIQIVLFASLYGAWAWSGRDRALRTVTVVVLVAMFGWLVWSLMQTSPFVPTSSGVLPAEPAMFAYSLAVNVVYFGGAIAWGQAAWAGARRDALLVEQRERERQLRLVEQQRALHDERARIARDLHDVVAHHVSAIGVQAAGAGRVLDRDPASARAALDTIEASSRRAVSQMHQLVGLLREHGDDGRAAQPGLADLTALTGAAGGLPPVDLRTVGEPFAVPATVEHSLYRIAQEAVTNVRRHAAARHASVVVRYVAGDIEGAPSRAVELEVLDDGRGRPDLPTSDSGGFGLRGITERAALHDGEVEIGPRPQRGWRVRVRVPVDP